MHVWITKFALTQGVWEAKAESTYLDDMIKVRGVEGGYDQFFHGKDWHTTLESAQRRVVEMAESKLKSLHKQMCKVKEVMDKNR